MYVRVNLPPVTDKVEDLLRTWRIRAMHQSVTQREGEELVLYGLAKHAELKQFRSALSMFLKRKGVLLEYRIGWVVEINEEEYQLEARKAPKVDCKKPAEAINRLLLAGRVRDILERNPSVQPAYERAVKILEFVRESVALGAPVKSYERVLAQIPALPRDGAGGPSILRGEERDVPNELSEAEKETLKAGARAAVGLRLCSVAPPAGF
jgi:hypothetical protein